MPYEFLPDVALADIAFKATASSVEGLFQSCADALTDIMVDPKSLQATVKREFSLNSESLDRLLYDFLSELIVAKDVDSLLFKEYKVRVSHDHLSMSAEARGEPIDRIKHDLRNDVKAVTMHMFGVTHEREEWTATVVLDI